MGDPVEQNAIANAVEHLVERYPSLGRTHVEQVVVEETARFADAKVREYVPSLIEHAADERLRQEAEPVEPGASDPGGPVIIPNDGAHLDPFEVEQRARDEHPGLLFGDPGGGPV